MDEIKTNMGYIPIGDYLDIVAQQNGFEDYCDMVSCGLIYDPVDYDNLCSQSD